MAKKSFNEKLHDSKDMPKIIIIDDEKTIKNYDGNHMLIAPPLEYNNIMSVIPDGKIVTAPVIRDFLARKYDADFTCPLTAGIFINLCAMASAERDDDKIPFWRTLKTDGELNSKYPMGIDYQKEMLEREGHTFYTRGRKNIRYFVEDYEDKLVDLDEL